MLKIQKTTKKKILNKLKSVFDNFNFLDKVFVEYYRVRNF